MSDGPPSGPRALRRELGPVSATLLTAGAMIGTGVFVSPFSVARGTTGPWEMAFAWALGGGLSLLGALCFAEAGAAIPETGGLSVYLRRAYGPRAEFAFGWTMLAVLVPSSLAFFAQVAATHLRDARLIQWVYFPEATIVALTAVNVLGLRTGAAVQNALSLVKIAGILGVALFALAHRGAEAGSAAPAVTAVTVARPAVGLGAWLGAMISILWAYDGWIDVTSVAGEVREPRANVPRALLGGTVLVTALYLLAIASFVAIVGFDALAAPGPDRTVFALGPWERSALRPWFDGLVAIASVGGAAVGLMSGARVVFAVAREGGLPRALGRVSGRGVPAGAIVVCGALALAYARTPLGRLGEIFVVGAWPFYALGALAIARLRARGALDGGGFRVPWAPWPQRAFATLSAAIVLMYTWQQPRSTALSLGVIALGFVLRPLWSGRRADAQPTR